jgi:hypothetical protein
MAIHWEQTLQDAGLALTVIFSGAAAMLAYRSLLPSYTLLEWNIRRISHSELRAHGELHINTSTPHLGQCEGALKIGTNTIIFPVRTINLMTSGVYHVTLDGQYIGALVGIGNLRLKIMLGNQKPKILKMKIPISIPKEYDAGNLPDPSKIKDIFGHVNNQEP